MTPEWTDGLLAAVFFVVAVLYSSVGHAGASGYIAAMALFGLPAAIVKPTALALNIVVGGIGLFRFARAKLVPWRMALPLVLASAPAAYLGAALQLSPIVYQRILAVVLLVAAVQLWRTAALAGSEAAETTRALPWWQALAIGAGIGFVAGLSGTGGAIFLTPLLIFGRYAETRVASGASVLFVLANSSTGLAAAVPAAGGWPPSLPLWLGAVVLGALVGTQFGRGALPVGVLRRVLAVVLVVAAAKLALV
ncbi:MAG TPA: sulfite exporter TauE/SafE family protein [Xanthomonadales bacterium]|nr:sulfite exporter TauE/SafE family protein [Xanthomonadales bacterium]